MSKKYELKHRRDTAYTGEIITNVTTIDDYLDRIIIRFFGLEGTKKKFEKGEKFLSLILVKMTTGPKLNLFDALGLHKQKKFKGKYDTLRKDIMEIISVRNAVAHGEDVSYGKIVKVRNKGKIFVIDRKFMNNFRKDINNLTKIFMNILRNAEF